MKKIYVAIFLTLQVSCTPLKILSRVGNETLEPEHFNIEIPFFLREGVIYIPTYWGEENKIPHFMLFDNHAPTSATYQEISKNSTFQKLGELFVDRKVVAGQKMRNIFYSANEIRLGNVSFKNTLFNQLPLNYISDTSIIKCDGLFGTNLLVKGVWKIDFEKRVINFSDNIDSISILEKSQKIVSKFSATNDISIDISFSNKVTQTFEIDLGSNVGLLQKKRDFDRIVMSHRVSSFMGPFSNVAGTVQKNYYKLENQQVEIDGQKVSTSVLSFDDLNSNLVGMPFFSSFKFVIFDYVNRNVYLSKEKN